MSDPVFHCGCRRREDADSEIKSACSAKPDPFTAEELKIFERLRRIRREADQCKSRLREVIAEEDSAARGKPSGEAEECIELLSMLRKERRELLRRADEAWNRRMVLLGHLPESPVTAW